MKNKTTALILSVLVGGLGIDRFYLGSIPCRKEAIQSRYCALAL